MDIFRFNKDSEVKEFSLKLLPNIDNIKENTIYVDSYYRGSEKITRKEFFDAKYKGDNDVVRVEKNFSYALLNGEYCIFPFSNRIKKFLSFAIDGKYYKILPETENGTTRYYSVDEYKEFRKGGEYEEMETNNKLHLIKKVIFSDTPINVYGIDNDWSIKFDLDYIHGFPRIDNLRFERDSANLIWDGTVESKDKVQEFLKNKDLRLEDYKQ